MIVIIYSRGHQTFFFERRTGWKLRAGCELRTNIIQVFQFPWIRIEQNKQQSQPMVEQNCDGNRYVAERVNSFCNAVEDVMFLKKRFTPFSKFGPICPYL